MTLTVDQLLTEARRQLATAPFAPQSREALLLMRHALGLSEAQVIARLKDEVSAAEIRTFRSMLRRRLAGEPVAYVLEEKEFFGRSFFVDRRALIPRPETEHLVEVALEQALPPHPRILDLGTGSGCLAVTLAAEIPDARVVATDISFAALRVAAVNIRRHRAAEGVALAALDLTRGLALQHFDLVVCNPPYVGLDEAEGLSREILDFEPPVAVFAPGDGDSVLHRLLEQTSDLRRGVPLIVEIGHGQLSRVEQLATACHLRMAECRADYAGIPRVVVLQRC